MPVMPEKSFPAHASPAIRPTCVQNDYSTAGIRTVTGDGSSIKEASTSYKHKEREQGRQFRPPGKRDNQGGLDRMNGVGDDGASLLTPPSRLSLVPPPPLISPAFTPPTTPGGTVYAPGARDALTQPEWYWDGSGYVKTNHREASRSMKPSTDASLDDSYHNILHPPQPHLQPSLSSPALDLSVVDRLPTVTCAVRARIPTTIGTEMFLHLYHNNVDDKEHLAIVFGTKIRSRSLDAVRPGETEMDRMVRGAYTGRLFPGRASSSAIGGDRIRGHRRGGSMGKVDSSRKTSDSQAKSDEQRGFEYIQSAEEADIGSDINDDYEERKEEGEEEGKREEDHDPPPLVRIHSECYTGETVWSARCDCGEQLDEAARLMALSSEINGRTTSKYRDISSINLNHNRDTNTTTITTNRESEHHSTSKITTSTVSTDESQNTTGPGGVIIYLRQEGRGIGLGEKLKAYNLQDLGSDTYDANLLLRHPADARSYGLATAMLVDLDLGGERGIRLLTNNPDKVRAVEGPGREVVVKERVGMVPLAWKTGGEGSGKGGVRGVEVERYLTTKVFDHSSFFLFSSKTLACPVALYIGFSIGSEVAMFLNACWGLTRPFVLFYAYNLLTYWICPVQIEKFKHMLQPP